MSGEAWGDFEKNQFLKQFHGSDAHHKGVDPKTFEYVTEMRKLLYKWGGGWIPMESCAITAATCGAQWQMRIRDAKAKQSVSGQPNVGTGPSPLSNLILPSNNFGRIP